MSFHPPRSPAVPQVLTPSRRGILRMAGAGLVLGALPALPLRADEVLDRDVLTARMAEFMRREIAAGSLTGGVLLIEKDGETVLNAAYGHSDAAATRAAQTDDLFRIASMTKPVVSAAIMGFVEEGRIALDAPIATYLPELADLKLAGADGQAVAPARQPLVYDLLRHTGGFTYSMFGAADPALREAYGKAGIEQIQTDMSVDEMLRRLAEIPLAFEPGTRFEYSIGIDLLGFILERVSGQTLDVVLRERILDPLGMGQTGFAVTEADLPRLAQVPGTDPMKPVIEGWMRVEKPRGQGYLSGGGGLVSTAADYMRFCRMVLNDGALDGRRVLSPASLRLMLSDHIAGLGGSTAVFTGPGYGFGLGFAVRRAEGGAFVEGSPGDANWSGVSGTTFTVDRHENLAAILMAAAPSQRNHLRFAFRNITYGALTETGIDNG